MATNTASTSKSETRYQYTRDFLLSRKNKTSDICVLKDIDPSSFQFYFTPFTKNGIKKITFAKSLYSNHVKDPNVVKDPKIETVKGNYSEAIISNYKFIHIGYKQLCSSQNRQLSNNGTNSSVQNNSGNSDTNSSNEDNDEVKSLTKQLKLSLEKLDQANALNGILEKRMEVAKNDMLFYKILLDEEKEKKKEEHNELLQEMNARESIHIENEKKIKKEITQIIEDEFECAICNEVLVDAIILGCFHTFCRHCINDWTKTCYGAELLCPKCRLPYRKDNIRCYSTFQSLYSKVEHLLTSEFKAERTKIINSSN